MSAKIPLKADLIKINYKLSLENARLTKLLVQQTAWLRSISEHYTSMSDQLLGLVKSMNVGQQDFINYFKAINTVAEKNQKTIEAASE